MPEVCHLAYEFLHAIILNYFTDVSSTIRHVYMLKLGLDLKEASKRTRAHPTLY